MKDPLSSDLASLKIQRDVNPEVGASRRAWVLAIVALVVLGGGSVYAVNAFGARVFQTEVSVTEIRTISPAQASTLVTSSGYLVPQLESKVNAKILGRVIEARVKEGDPVTAGDILFRLDAAELQSAVAASRARALAARARELSAVAALAETQRQYDRAHHLFQEGASARSVAEDLESRVAVLKESAAAARADTAAAAAELRQLELSLGDLTVVAPISGVVTTKPAMVGDLVGPGARMPAAEIADFSTLMVETDVPEGRLGLIQKGGPAEIVLDARPSVRYRGQIAEISPRVNRSKATVVVKVRFLDPAETLLPDMAARVGFLAAELDPAAMKEPPKLFVPGSAVVERQGKKVVFRVNEGKARIEPVTLGPAQGAGFQLIDGPSEGTRVIADPPAALEDGYPVKEKI